MERTFRLKLFAIVGAAALGLIIIIIVGALVERRVDRHLSTIREEYIPKIGLADQLQSAFERISRRLQDAAQANDVEVVDDARRQKVVLIEQIVAARDAIDATHAAALRVAIDDYFSAAELVTRRLARGERAEIMLDDVKSMQAKQALVEPLIAEAAHFDEKGLTRAFVAASEAQDAGARLRLVISVACLALVLGLSVWITRGLYRSLAGLAEGFRRFGEGDFATAIPATTNDELAAVARDANQMAERLRRLAEDRDRGAWIEAGQVGLADELRGELTPEEVGTRALNFLARYFEAPLGVLYYGDPDEVLRLLATYGVSNADRDRIDSFTVGDGLLGEAARHTELTIVRAPAGHLPIRSGLAGGEPRSLVFVPLVQAGTVRGVLELAVVAVWEPLHTELMRSIRDSLTIGIEVARGRASTRALLDETQRQAAELLQARQGLEAKAMELARASSYKSQFLANMSHELRTPLNAILGFSELLLDGVVPVDSPEHTEFLADIISSGRHLLQLINDILDLSKVEAGKLEFRSEPISLAHTVDEVIGILQTTATQARVTLVSEIDAGIDAVVLDPSRLKQVLFNYASNAIKFTNELGAVTIRARAEGAESVRIEVTDTGIGIAAHEVERLFREFQQIEHPKRDGKRRGGTGLGLALTKRLVEAQGGSVGVRSALGEGSTFHAILPRVWDNSAALTPPAHATEDKDPGDPDPAGPPVGEMMVIDDDPVALKVMSGLLKNIGYKIRCERDCVVALRRIREAPPIAIVLDLRMPGMSGFEFLTQLRQSTEGRRIPVIVWTSKDLTLDETALLRASAAAVVIKGANNGARVLGELAALIPSGPVETTTGSA